MRMDFRLILVASFSVLVATGCSGDKEAKPSPAAGTQIVGTEVAAAIETTSKTGVVQPGLPVTILGEVTRLQQGANGAKPLNAATAKRGDCGLPVGTLATCQAATGSGGTFLITQESTAADPTLYSVVVRCGTNPAVPIAAAIGLKSPLAAELSFDLYGEVIGVGLNGTDGSDAALIYQPTGDTCPSIFGVGPVKTFSAMGGGKNIVTMTRPDQSTICVSSDPAAGFVVVPASGNKCS